jgi:hypothetical protein
MKPTQPSDFDLGDDLEFTEQPLRAASGGTWMIGRIAGHRFEALVFPEHAENPDWEIGDSRISKLWLQRLSNKRVVFNWDRGSDVPAADQHTQQIVDFLTEGLAEHLFAE